MNRDGQIFDTVEARRRKIQCDAAPFIRSAHAINDIYATVKREIAHITCTVSYVVVVCSVNENARLSDQWKIQESDFTQIVLVPGGNDYVFSSITQRVKPIRDWVPTLKDHVGPTILDSAPVASSDRNPVTETEHASFVMEHLT